jgi:long-chain acyl-CoA synthetase
VRSELTSDDIARRVEGQTVVSRFLATAAARPHAPALRWKESGEYRRLTFAEYAERAARVAGGLAGLGVERGSRVVLLMGNRPEFHIADVGALLLGATPISVYSSSSPEQIRYLVSHCAAHVAVVEHEGYLERLASVRRDLPELAHVVLVDAPRGAAPSGVTSWDALVHSAGPIDLTAAGAAVEPHDLATVIYTSGTTGEPKGVMLDHANVCWAIESLRLALGFSPEGFRIISYLPAAHVAERMTSHYSGAALGYEVTTCPDIRELGRYLAETRPQMFFGVPRTFEKIHGVVRGILAADPGRERAFDDALAVGARAAASRSEGTGLPRDLELAYASAEEEQLRPARELLGLDAVECAVTAAAPIPVEILEFFRALGVPLSELYGLSESSGPITWEPQRVRPGTVGVPIPGEEVRLADDGEVLCRGGNVFRGYLDDPAQTAEALDADGWLHSGDVGEFDADGYLRIIDRKKELIITAGGKNVAPAILEAELRAQPLIGQACVFGDDREYITALLVLDPDVVPAWAAMHGVDAASPERLVADPTVLHEIEQEVTAANEHFAHAEQVRRWTLLPGEWLPDSDELTATMKLRRRVIASKYASEIDALYR